jgi:3-dehydro-L-gulonate 2-dehydrogenase
MLNERVFAADHSHPAEQGTPVTCPGERTVQTRKKSMKEGVRVDEQIWSQVQEIADGNLNVTDISGK